MGFHGWLVLVERKKIWEHLQRFEGWSPSVIQPCYARGVGLKFK